MYMSTVILSLLLVSIPAGYSWYLHGASLTGNDIIDLGYQDATVSLAINGQILAMGAPGDNQNTGCVWIFNQVVGDDPSQMKWIQHGHKMVGTGAEGFSAQGKDLALSYSGEILIVGGPEDGDAQGAAWIYTFHNDTMSWLQDGPKLRGMGGDHGFQGGRVAINGRGNIAGVGGYYDAQGRGAVWMFERSEGGWIQLGNKLVGQGSQGSTYQGAGLAISFDGEIVVIGGPDDHELKGAVWIFVRNDTTQTYSQHGNKMIAHGNIGPTCSFGARIAMSPYGDFIAIAGLNDDAGIGGIWFYHRIVNATTNVVSYVQMGHKLVGATSPPHSQSSQGIGLDMNEDGTMISVGGPLDDNNIGAVWIWRRQNNATDVWTQEAKLIGSAHGEFQGEGVSVSGTGDIVAISGYENGRPIVWMFREGDAPPSSSKMARNIALGITIPLIVMLAAGIYYVFHQYKNKKSHYGETQKLVTNNADSEI